MVGWLAAMSTKRLSEDVIKYLKDCDLEGLGPKLESLGVRAAADLALVNDADLVRWGLLTIERHRFLGKVRKDFGGNDALTPEVAVQAAQANKAGQKKRRQDTAVGPARLDELLGRGNAEHQVPRLAERLLAATGPIDVVELSQRISRIAPVLAQGFSGSEWPQFVEACCRSYIRVLVEDGVLADKPLVSVRSGVLFAPSQEVVADTACWVRVVRFLGTPKQVSIVAAICRASREVSDGPQVWGKLLQRWYPKATLLNPDWVAQDELEKKLEEALHSDYVLTTLRMRLEADTPYDIGQVMKVLEQQTTPKALIKFMSTNGDMFRQSPDGKKFCVSKVEGQSDLKECKGWRTVNPFSTPSLPAPTPAPNSGGNGTSNSSGNTAGSTTSTNTSTSSTAGAGAGTAGGATAGGASASTADSSAGNATSAASSTNGSSTDATTGSVPKSEDGEVRQCATEKFKPPSQATVEAPAPAAQRLDPKQAFRLYHTGLISQRTDQSKRGKLEAWEYYTESNSKCVMAAGDLLQLAEGRVGSIRRDDPAVVHELVSQTLEGVVYKIPFGYWNRRVRIMTTAISGSQLRVGREQRKKFERKLVEFMEWVKKERGFGFYQCESCGSRWRSGFSYEEIQQQCLSCGAWAKPYRIVDLETAEQREAREKGEPIESSGKSMRKGPKAKGKGKGKWHQSEESAPSTGHEDQSQNQQGAFYPYQKGKRAGGAQKGEPPAQRPRINGEEVQFRPGKAFNWTPPPKAREPVFLTPRPKVGPKAATATAGPPPPKAGTLDAASLGLSPEEMAAMGLGSGSSSSSGSGGSSETKKPETYQPGGGGFFSRKNAAASAPPGPSVRQRVAAAIAAEPPVAKPQAVTPKDTYKPGAGGFFARKTAASSAPGDAASSSAATTPAASQDTTQDASQQEAQAYTPGGGGFFARKRAAAAAAESTEEAQAYTPGGGGFFARKRAAAASSNGAGSSTDAGAGAEAG